MPPGSEPSQRQLPRPEHNAPLTLNALARKLGASVRGNGELAVRGITASSDLVRPGDIFAALPGESAHGAAYIDQAVARGAVAVLTDHEGLTIREGSTMVAELPCVVAAQVRASLGAAAAAIYDYPSRKLSVVGITGTSGKTTTSYFVRAGLLAAGTKSGLVGTVETIVADQVLTTGFTTPEAPELQALLAVMAQRQTRAAVMEVSSHALSLGRVNAVEFAVGAFTNLSAEHLDFHPTMEDYFQAKALLFDVVHGAKVISVDDEWGRRLAGRVGGSAVTVSIEGDEAASWRAENLRTEANVGTRFTVIGQGTSFEMSCAVPGRYNVSNMLVALAILDSLGVSPDEVVGALSSAVVPGRMERIDAGQDFSILVDYSHKPAAVQGALNSLRPLTSGKLIVVLGCGGDRDHLKRPVMGQIAAELADVLIVTDDNPRSEDPAAIRASVLAGARSAGSNGKAEVIEIGDRAEAIAHAVSIARPNDTVLIAGKGHEQGQEFADRVVPFDDRVHAREALMAR